MAKIRVEKGKLYLHPVSAMKDVKYHVLIDESGWMKEFFDLPLTECDEGAEWDWPSENYDLKRHGQCGHPCEDHQLLCSKGCRMEDRIVAELHPLPENRIEKLKAVDLLVFQGLTPATTEIFEPDWTKSAKDLFVPCLTGCNSRYIKTGTFPEFSYFIDRCRVATDDERKQYFQMKDDRFKDLEEIHLHGSERPMTVKPDQLIDVSEMKSTGEDAFPHVTSVLEENKAMKEVIGALTTMISKIREVVEAQRPVPNFAKGGVMSEPVVTSAMLSPFNNRLEPGKEVIHTIDIDYVINQAKAVIMHAELGYVPKTDDLFNAIKALEGNRGK